MRIVITGAAGFIGSQLAERFLAHGHSVIGIDCFTDYYDPKIKELNAREVEKKGGKILRLDLASADLASALEGAELVYHLAAQPGISQKVSFDTYLRNNVLATHRLLEACRTIKILKMFVNIATSSVYGVRAGGDEKTAPAPTSYYGVTKLASEQLTLSYCRSFGMPVCSTRLFSVYGPRERPEKVNPSYARAIFDEQFTFPYREGSENHVRSYTYIDDIIDGLTAIAGNLAACVGEIINLGMDSAITTAQQLELIERAAGRKAKIVRVPRLSGDQLETRANIEKARRLLGYHPKITPEEGTRRFVEWYKENIIPLGFRNQL